MPQGINPIIGYNGKIRIGSGATIQEAAWVGEWEVEGKNDVTTFGPFIGDKNKYPVSTGLIYNFSLKGTFRQGGDAAIRAFKYAQANGTTPPAVELSAANGDYFLFNAPVIESFKSSLKADGSNEFEIKGQAVASVVSENPA